MTNYLSSLCNEFGTLPSWICSWDTTFQNSTVAQAIGQSIKNCIAESSSITTSNYTPLNNYQIVCTHSDGTSESLKIEGLDERVITYIKEINPQNLEDKVSFVGKSMKGIFKFDGERPLDFLRYYSSEKASSINPYFNESIQDNEYWSHDYGRYTSAKEGFLSKFLKPRSFSPFYKGAVIGLGGLLVTGSAYCTYRAVESFFRTVKNPASPTSFRVAKVVSVIFFGSATIGFAYGTFVVQQNFPHYR